MLSADFPGTHRVQSCFIALFAACIFSCLYTSCVKQYTSPVLIPADWPMPGLVPPADSIRDYLPFSERFLGDNKYIYTSDNMKYWALGFWGDYSFEELVNHTESILLPQGYKVTGDHSKSTATLVAKWKRHTNPAGDQVWVGFENNKSGNWDVGKYKTYYYDIELH